MTILGDLAGITSHIIVYISVQQIAMKALFLQYYSAAPLEGLMLETVSKESLTDHHKPPDVTSHDNYLKPTEQ